MTDEEYDALPGLTDEQEAQIAEYLFPRYEEIRDALVKEAIGNLNVQLSVKAKDEVEMFIEYLIMDILKDQYESEEEGEEVIPN